MYHEVGKHLCRGEREHVGESGFGNVRAVPRLRERVGVGKTCWKGDRPGQVFKLSRGGLPDIISLLQIYVPLLIQ